jgi:transcriptional regulator
VYVPKAFAIDDSAEVLAAISRIGTGHVVTHTDGRFDASFVPVIVDPGDPVTLRGHLARANTHHRAIADGADALVVVGGVDAYVSPSWYASKREHGRVVPTWNYELIHVHGTVRIVDDTAFVERIVRDLTERHERTQPQPWSVDDAPRDFIDGQLKAIVGIEITAHRIEGKRKMSQNRPAPDVSAVVASIGEPVASAMRRANARVVDVSFDDPSVTSLLDEYLALILERSAERGVSVDLARSTNTSADADASDFAGAAFVGVEIGDRLVGCGGVRMHGDVAEIKRMFVTATARGAGIGRLLLGALVDRSQQLGATVVRLDTNDVLTEAISLYSSGGFREIERYNDNPHAHRWFELRLS